MDNLNNAVSPEDAQETPGLAVSGGRRVYLVRHGITEWNRQFRYQGVTDIPLCPEGEEQARRVAGRLSGLDIRRVVSSPLKRSMSTAGIIAGALSVPQVEVWDDLAEVDFGGWEGLSVREIKEKYGEEIFDKWRNAQLDVAVSGGEDPDNVYERATRAAERILASQDGMMVIVGHGAIFRAVLPPLIGVQRSSVFWKMRMDNCSISGVDIDKKGRASVAFLNDTLHLKAEAGDIGSLPFP